MGKDPKVGDPRAGDLRAADLRAGDLKAADPKDRRASPSPVTGARWIG